MWKEFSYNRYDFTYKNRIIAEEYNEELDDKFEEQYGLDISKEFVDWEE